MRAVLLLLLVCPPAAGPLWAQIDYRALDHGRPLRTEDAYALERYAFELALPYELERGNETTVHLLTPELSHGIARNIQLGVEWPFGAVDGAETDWGLAGPRVSLLYNVNTESRSLPALGARGEVVVPAGALAPGHLLVTVTGLATRSWGRTRVHVNLAATLGPAGNAGAAGPPRWRVSAAVDRTILRRSILLLGELQVRRAAGETGTLAGLGARAQLTPTLVLDAGIARGLDASARSDLGLTVGLSHVFGVAWLLPRSHR